MAVSYNKLWKLMIDKKINKSQLCKKIKISSSTMAKMTNEEMVAMTVLEKICAELECDISDIMEFTDYHLDPCQIAHGHAFRHLNIDHVALQAVGR